MPAPRLRIRSHPVNRHSCTTGPYFYNARYYNPGLGRFLSPDTLVPTPGNPQSLNRYSYVENNPVRWTDPSGHFAHIFIGIFMGLLAGTLAAEGFLALGFGLVGATVAGAMVGGAVAGGISAAIAGGDIALNMMLGAAFAGIAAYTGPPLFAFYAASLGRFGAAMATGATLGAAFGAAGTAITGGNILQGTLSGAVSGAVMAAVAYGVTYLQGQSPALQYAEAAPGVGHSGTGSDLGPDIEGAISILRAGRGDMTPYQQKVYDSLTIAYEAGKVKVQDWLPGLPEKFDAAYYGTGDILIKSTVSDWRLPGVLMHEATHMYRDICGLSYTGFDAERAAYSVQWSIDTSNGRANYTFPSDEWIRATYGY